MKIRKTVLWRRLKLTARYYWLLLVRLLVLGQWPWHRPWEDENILDE